MKLGNLQGNEYQVLEGLEPGDTIVVSGLLNLRDGVPIDPQPADPQPVGASASPSTPAQSNAKPAKADSSATTSADRSQEP